jgi:hypothetical protein
MSIIALYGQARTQPELKTRPRGLYYKTLRTHNIRQIDRFLNKLVPYIVHQKTHQFRQTR